MEVKSKFELGIDEERLQSILKDEKLQHQLELIEDDFPKSMDLQLELRKVVVALFKEKVNEQTDYSHLTDQEYLKTLFGEPKTFYKRVHSLFLQKEESVQTLEKEDSNGASCGKDENKPDKSDEHHAIHADKPLNKDVITEENNDVYMIKHGMKQHGLAFILTYGQFESDNIVLESRPGFQNEETIFKEIWEDYGFKVMTMTRKNAVREKTLEFLKEVEEEWNEGKYDILVGSVSSHGDEVEEAVPDSDKKTVRHRIFCKDGQTIYTDTDLIQRFENEKSDKNNKNKPKLFFIQACRSRYENDAKDYGTTLQVTGGSETVYTFDARGRPPLQKAAPPPPGTTSVGQSLSAQIEGQGQQSTQIEQSQTQLNGTADRESQGLIPPSAEQISTTNIVTDVNNSVQKVDEIRKDMYDLNVDNFNTHSQTSSATKPLPLVYETTPAPCALDSLVMFASAAGKFAYAEEKSGGWLLSELEQALKDNQDMELLHLLTIVSNKMALDMETVSDDRDNKGLKCVPCICHMLRKDIYLKPLPQDS